MKRIGILLAVGAASGCIGQDYPIGATLYPQRVAARQQHLEALRQQCQPVTASRIARAKLRSWETRTVLSANGCSAIRDLAPRPPRPAARFVACHYHRRQNKARSKLRRSNRAIEWEYRDAEQRSTIPNGLKADAR
jgi:hypothetical protein